MKLLRKISVGAVNGVRGGFKNVTTRARVMTIVGIAHSYKEKTSENMATSYAFNGEFRAINVDGVECAAPVAYLVEPAQGLLRAQLDGLGGEGSVEFGFHIFVCPDETAIKGYVFEIEPLMEAKPSTALENLSARVGFSVDAESAKALGHDAAAESAKPKTKGHK